MHKRLRCAEDMIMCEIEKQLTNIQCADTKELGEAIDMVKDIEEAIYYITSSKAMKEKEEMEKEEVEEEEMEMKMEERDHRKGKSFLSRKRYMEAKEWNKDKAYLLKELEKYMIDVTADIMEIVEDASMEEKQYLEKKVNSLASKIGQMK